MDKLNLSVGNVIQFGGESDIHGMMIFDAPTNGKCLYTGVLNEDGAWELAPYEGPDTSWDAYKEGDI